MLEPEQTRHGHVREAELSGTVHLVKLCVGIESVEHLEAHRARMRREGDDTPPRHVTRMWPKRSAELLAGGSLYWVIRGAILCRQRILRLEEVTGQDGIRRCGIVLDPKIHRTRALQRRPFQGWRYLAPEDAPPDLPENRDRDDPIPERLNRALAEIGVL